MGFTLCLKEGGRAHGATGAQGYFTEHNHPGRGGG